jgi:hypothetical protein
MLVLKKQRTSGLNWQPISGYKIIYEVISRTVIIVVFLVGSSIVSFMAGSKGAVVVELFT